MNTITNPLQTPQTRLLPVAEPRTIPLEEKVIDLTQSIFLQKEEEIAELKAERCVLKSRVTELEELLRENENTISGLNTKIGENEQRAQREIELIIKRPKALEEKLKTYTARALTVESELNLNKAERRRLVLLAAGTSAAAAAAITGVGVAAGLGAIHCVLL